MAAPPPPPTATATAAPPSTRDRIVVAAAGCFARHGIDRVPLDEVAERAGVHRGTLHRHFPGGREEVVLAVLDHEARAFAAAMAAVIDAAPDAAEAAVEASTVATITARENRAVAPLLAEASTRAALLDPAAAHLRATTAAHWERIRARAEAEGALVNDADADLVVAHLFRIGLSLVNEPAGLATADQVRAYFRTFVVPALVRSAPRPARPSPRA